MKNCKLILNQIPINKRITSFFSTTHISESYVKGKPYTNPIEQSAGEILLKMT